MLLLEIIDKNANSVRKMLPENEVDEFNAVIETIKTMITSNIDIDMIDNAIADKLLLGNINHATEVAYFVIHISIGEEEEALFDKDDVPEIGGSLLAVMFTIILILFSLLLFYKL